jgi:hypothetical protein
MDDMASTEKERKEGSSLSFVALPSHVFFDHHANAKHLSLLLGH